MKTKKFTKKELEARKLQISTPEGLKELLSKEALENHMNLLEWLYRNHLDVLREYEATQGNIRVEFLS